MIEPFVFPLVIIALCAAIYLWGRFLTPYRETKRIIAKGRVISWEDAIHRTQSGKGVFVIYSRKLWWLEGDIVDKGVNVYIATVQSGLLVLAHPKVKNLRDLMEKEAPGRYKTIDTIPFVDPAP
jgi:hypothetical protein